MDLFLTNLPKEELIGLQMQGTNLILIMLDPKLVMFSLVDGSDYHLLAFDDKQTITSTSSNHYVILAIHEASHECL